MGFCGILPALVFRTTVTEGSGSVWVVRLDIAQNFCLTQFATIFPDGVFPGPVTTKARHFALAQNDYGPSGVNQTGRRSGGCDSRSMVLFNGAPTHDLSFRRESPSVSTPTASKYYRGPLPLSMAQKMAGDLAPRRAVLSFQHQQVWRVFDYNHSVTLSRRQWESSFDR